MSVTGDGFRIVLRPSRRLVLLLGGAYAGAFACLASLDLPVAVSAPALGFLVLSAFCDLGGHAAAASHRRVREVVLTADGGCRVMRPGATVIHGTLGAEGLVHPWGVCFPVHAANGKTLCVLVLPDMLDAEDFRRLRVMLRQQAQRPASGHSGDAIPWRRH